MADVSDSRIIEAYNDVRSDASETNWLILGYETNKQIVLQGSGSGGPAELAHSLQNDAVNYGYLRVSFKDDETSRTKFVLFTWKGDNAPVMRKGTGNMSVHISNVKALLKDYSIEINATEASDVSEEEIMKKIKAANY